MKLKGEKRTKIQKRPPSYFPLHHQSFEQVWCGVNMTPPLPSFPHTCTHSHTHTHSLLHDLGVLEGQVSVEGMFVDGLVEVHLGVKHVPQGGHQHGCLQPTSLAVPGALAHIANQLSAGGQGGGEAGEAGRKKC